MRTKTAGHDSACSVDPTETDRIEMGRSETGRTETDRAETEAGHGMIGEPRLMGATELRRRIGGSRERVRQLTLRSDFPRPVEVLRQGRVWLEDEVEDWIRRFPGDCGKVTGEGRRPRVAG